MVPLYFFPKVSLSQLVQGNRLNQAILRERGLDQSLSDIVDVERQTARQDLMGRGPGDSSGAILAALPVEGGELRRVGWYPDVQTWHAYQRPGEQEPYLWIGLDKAHPPTPADLRRGTLLKGHKVELAGQTYEIPVARSPINEGRLPRDLHWDDAGQLVSQVQAAWQQAWDDAGEVYEMFYVHNRLAGGLARALELAVRSVGLNYRYGRHEQRALHLIDSASWEEVLGALVDAPFVVQVLGEQKKSETTGASAGPSTPAG